MQKNSFKIYSFVSEFNLSDLHQLSKDICIIYRNYGNINHLENILKLKEYCKNIGTKIYLSNDIKLSIKLRLDGVYIPSFNNDLSHLSYSLKEKFNIIGSAHTLREIKIKEKQKVKKIFLSSLFKKNKNYLGINRFKLLKKLTKKDVIALGGVSLRNIKKLNLVNSLSFAGISYFEQKKGPKKGPFK